MSYESCLIEIAQHIRDSLREVEEIDCFTCSISMSGRVDGEINISIDLSHQYKYGFDVKNASNIDEMLSEFKRRFGWTQRNAPLCLPNAPQIEGKANTANAIPF